MKAFERIFLYSALAILFFYVFLVDGNVESQGVIQEEIRARIITIVNDEGQPVVELWADENGGLIGIRNKYNNPVVGMGVDKDDNGIIYVANKYLISVVGMGVNPEDDNGIINILNKYNNPVVKIGVTENDNGIIDVYNKHGEGIGSLP